MGLVRLECSAFQSDEGMRPLAPSSQRLPLRMVVCTQKRSFPHTLSFPPPISRVGIFNLLVSHRVSLRPRE